MYATIRQNHMLSNLLERLVIGVINTVIEHNSVHLSCSIYFVCLTNAEGDTWGAGWLARVYPLNF